MKFDEDKVTGRTAGLFISKGTTDCIANGDVAVLESVLREYSSVCGEKTKQRLIKAIVGQPHPVSKEQEELLGYGIDYSDTPIRGRCYVYLWFDSNGCLFYVGKGVLGRATDVRQRGTEFRERASGGFCRYVAYNMDERYALDLEQILIWESVLAGKTLLNIDGGSGMVAVQYCKHDRDGLLWYWNHESTISRFSELTGIDVIYDSRNTDMDRALDSRRKWWEGWGGENQQSHYFGGNAEAGGETAKTTRIPGEPKITHESHPHLKWENRSSSMGYKRKFPGGPLGCLIALIYFPIGVILALAKEFGGGRRR